MRNVQHDGSAADEQEDNGVDEESDVKGETVNQGNQAPRELRPKIPATEEEIEGPKKTRYFKG